MCKNDEFENSLGLNSDVSPLLYNEIKLSFKSWWVCSTHPMMASLMPHGTDTQSLPGSRIILKASFQVVYSSLLQMT